MFIMRGGVYLYTGQTRDPRRHRCSRASSSDRQRTAVRHHALPGGDRARPARRLRLHHAPSTVRPADLCGRRQSGGGAACRLRRAPRQVHLLHHQRAAGRQSPASCLPSRLGSAEHVAGLGFEFQVVAAVVLGGVSLAGGIGSLFGMALGVLILSFLSNGLRRLGLPTEWQLVITGMIIIAAVAFDELKRRQAMEDLTMGRLEGKTAVVTGGRRRHRPRHRRGDGARKARMSSSATSTTRRARPSSRSSSRPAARRTTCIATSPRRTTSPG